MKMVELSVLSRKNSKRHLAALAITLLWICAGKFDKFTRTYLINIYLYKNINKTQSKGMEEDLRRQFDEMGIEPSFEVIAKSLELCIDYRIADAAEFVEEWIAFSASNLNGNEPTVENLLDFERKVFQVKRDKELANVSKRKMNKNPVLDKLSHLNNVSDSCDLSYYGVETNDAIDDFVPETDGMDDMLDAYVCHTPKIKAKSTLARTPARYRDALFSPVSYSPVGTPRSAHTRAAPGSGKIVYTFGNAELIGKEQWSSLQQPKIRIKQLLLHADDGEDGETLVSVKDARYMFDNLLEKCEIAGDRIFHIGKSLCSKAFGDDADDFELTQVDMPSQSTVKTVGIICCDHDGPLDASSTLLVGSDEMRCRTTRLNFSKAKSVGVFPGQVVMVSGTNPRGEIFMVEEIVAERQLDMPAPPKLADQLSFVIASGPFTGDDDLVYDPLNDLLAYLKEHKPDVLILTGPFVDAEHKLISDNVTLAETFESFFEKMISGIVDSIGTTTTVLVIASHKDASADPVYPTMPMTLKKTYPNVHLLPDPSLIDLNGIVIGMTSTDIVDHLLNYELAINAGEKVKRVVNYLLQQSSFYPLNPAPENKMCFDSDLASKFANLDQVPNILILPSDQKCFIRVVNGCLTINPGRLNDNNGGTFARFIIKPPEPKEENNIFSYVGCQVRRV